MSDKKGISIKDYFNASSSITQSTAEPSNESAGNTSTSPPNEKTKDKQQPPLSENQPYHPISIYVFPETVFGKQKRSCKHDWFKRFPWLDYNAFDDSVTCYLCKRQNNQNNLKTQPCKENSFLEKCFTNWKKELEKFEKHQSSVTEQHLPTKYSFLDVLMLLNCLITKKREHENSTVGVSWLPQIPYSILLVKGYHYEVIAVMKIRTFCNC